jgi:hypothetical protein
MALTAKQKAAAVAEAQALIAKQKATLAKLEKQAAAANIPTNTPFGQAGSSKTTTTNVPPGTQFIPTVTIGGAPAGYIPDIPQATATFGGAPSAYKTPSEMGMGVTSTTSNVPKQTKEISKEDKDAYALLEEAFKLYGLDSLVSVIRGYMQDDLGVEQAKLKLKTEPVYKERFKGNELRAAKGLNVLDEASYLELENDYSETLRSYGLSDYFGVAVDATSRLARQKKMAEVIGNDISAVEFKSRISTATSRVQNADKNTKDAFKALYGIGDSDLVKYFLDPTKGSEELKTKATAAEISGAALSTGLAGTSLATAEELAKLGVDKATALKGYGDIAEYLPRTEFLGQVYDETGIKYDRASAEAETFRGTASEKRKREQLKAIEEAQFGGTSGRLRTGRASDNSGAF